MRSYRDTLELTASFSMYSSLKTKILEMKRRKSLSEIEEDPYEICSGIADDFFNSEDVYFLTPLQNKVRKISYGFDLSRDLCLLQRHFTTLGLNETISHILENEKYQEIAKNIKSRKTLELKREKYFQTQALSFIKDSLHESNPEKETENGVRRIEPTASEHEIMHEHSSSTASANYRETHIDLSEATHQDIGRVLPEADDQISFRMSNINTQQTRISEIPRPLHDITIGDIPMRDLDRTTVSNPDVRDHDLQTYNRLTDFSLANASESRTEDRNELPELLQKDNSASEDLGDLPDLSVEMETERQRRRRSRPVIDEQISIPNYAERARRLNQSLAPISRTRIFEGSPTILNAAQAGNFLTTSGVRNGFLGTVRSSVLQNLYSRHLVTQSVPHVNFIVNQPSRSAPAQRLAVQNVEEVVGEEILGRSGMQMQGERVHLENVSVVQPPSRELNLELDQRRVGPVGVEDLNGVPVSRILQREVSLPHPIGRANPWIPVNSPRLQNLQGTTIEPPSSEPWFLTINQPAPSDKWREFDFVRECLKEIWTAKDEAGLPKCASLREIIEGKDSWSRENALTLLRMVDKLSLRREVLLIGSGFEVSVYPFEIPYISSLQYYLTKKELKY